MACHYLFLYVLLCVCKTKSYKHVSENISIVLLMIRTSCLCEHCHIPSLHIDTFHLHFYQLTSLRPVTSEWRAFFASVAGSSKPENCLYRAPVNIASRRGLLMTAIITGWAEQQLRERIHVEVSELHCPSLSRCAQPLRPSIIQHIAHRRESDAPPRSALTTMSSAGRLDL